MCKDEKQVKNPADTQTTGTVFTTGRINALTLKNRTIRAGCFEGMSQGGNVTEQLVEHHRQVAAGGVAMTTVAYCSVSHDGRAFGHELWMRPEIVPDLRRLTEAVHREGAAASIQLGHCGFFANRKEIGMRPLGASPKLCLFRMSVCREMSIADIQQKVEDFSRAAVLAKEAGFDAVELHAGHGYLLSQFLSPWTNRRKDQYGGILANRLRFPLQVLRSVRTAVGPDFPILIKMNHSDGFRGGLQLEKAIEVARAFEREGADALIPSCGFTARTPLYMMRGNVPTLEMARSQEQVMLKLGMSLFGWLMVQRYAFEPLFQIAAARRVKDAVGIPVIYIGGVLSLQDMQKVKTEGFDFMELGRATVRDPNFVNRIQVGEIEVSDCDHCNRCIAPMSTAGVYCVSAEKGLWSN
jgi:2,4-dienoyl-CoA reductase-like NADH-dependent reductase (Old Yellow Enzyme family)